MRKLERRVERLEAELLASNSVEIERAGRIVEAFYLVRHEPESATDEDRKIVATSTKGEWDEAFGVAVKAAGGLEAVVLASMDLPKNV